MEGSEAKFNWYFLCTTLNGWIAFTWITFLANETSTVDEAQLILMAVPYLTVSCSVGLCLSRRANPSSAKSEEKGVDTAICLKQRPRKRNMGDQ